MVQYCRQCGKELDDNAKFCDKCGFELKKNLNQNNKNEEIKEQDNEKLIKKTPLILATISIVVSIAECLGTPILMGWDNILTAMGVGIAGGLIGILLEKLDEPLIGAVEFIATGTLIFIFIGQFGEISSVLYIIAAVLTLYVKGYHTKRKKLWILPILTFILIFGMLITSGVVYQMNAENAITVDNIAQNLSENYGYYNCVVSGDIYVGADFDYLSVNVDFYDEQGTILYSAIAWNQLNPDSQKTYKFDGNYYGQKAPVRAEIKVVDSSKSTTPLYSENITLTTSNGV